MKIGKNLASIITAGTLALIGSGCYPEPDRDSVSIWSVRGDKNSLGFIRFHYRGSDSLGLKSPSF